MKTGTIALFGLDRQRRALAASLRRAVLHVLDSGHYILGPEGKAFEAEFAEAHGARHCVGLSSGTDALELALRALGIGPGDEVIVPSFTFFATASAVSAVGAKPVFADVNADTLTLGSAEIEAVLTAKTKAVIPVHLYGQPADMDSIVALGRSRKFAIVEDCAQAHLAIYRGRSVGTFGAFGAFSFYPSKNLGAAGDAGAVITNDKALAETCASLSDCGRPATGDRYIHKLLGHNRRLDEMQAAILRVKLKKLPDWTSRRREIAARYHELLAGLPLTLPPLGEGGTRPACHLFVVRTQRRDELARHLAGLGIGTAVYYSIPLHLQPVYAEGKPPICLPNSEAASKTVLALPIYPELSDAEVRRIAEAVRSFFAR